MVKNRALFYAVQKFLSDGTIENKRALKRAYYDLARPTYEFADVVRYLPFLRIERIVTAVPMYEL